MSKINISVYTKLDDKENVQTLVALKDDEVIKYIDSDGNKVILDMERNIMKRENEDYVFTFNFKLNNIVIHLKKMRRDFDKRIKTISIKKNNHNYNVKYQLVDERVSNEYHLKY